MNYLLGLLTSYICLSSSFSFFPYKRFFNGIKNRFSEFQKKKLITVYDPNILDKLKKFSDDKIAIIDRENNIIYSNYTDFLEDNSELKLKETISISPGGLQGFYLIGIVDFMKHNYNLDSYLLTGASAGAWSCLLMSYKGDTKKFIKSILDEMSSIRVKSLFEAQLYLKKFILKKNTIKDFDFSKTFIGVTVLKNLDLSTNLFYNFNNLEDALDCCIASSHIPFLTGGFINKYNNKISFDGGFSNSPYLNLNNTVLHVNPNMWSKRMHVVINLDEIINKKFEDVNLYELYVNGFMDTKNNKDKLDAIFHI